MSRFCVLWRRTQARPQSALKIIHHLQLLTFPARFERCYSPDRKVLSEVMLPAAMSRLVILKLEKHDLSFGNS